LAMVKFSALLSLSSLPFLRVTSGKYHDEPIYGMLGLGGDMTRKPIPSMSQLALFKATASSTLSPLSIESGDEVTLTYSIDEPSDKDWIAFYCSDNLDTVEDSSYFDYVWTNGCGADCTFATKILNGRQEYCEFRFFTETAASNYNKLGVSDRIHITDAKSSLSSLHLSLTENNDEMRISWTSGSSDAPTVVFSTDADFTNPSSSEGSCKTYKQSDMCESPATTETSFVEPGMLCTAVMTSLSPDTKYYYKVTSDGSTYSDPVSFLSAPPTDDPDYSFSFITYGDMGMWSGDNGEASVATASISTAQVNDHGVRRIDHFGDISYARGVSGTWDAWFDLIEPYASQVPYMITIGNHEFDYSSGGENDPSGEDAFRPAWWNGGSDSGGECSVPMYNRFNMPKSSELSNSIYWYDFAYANVHTIMLSSEHNCTEGSPQYTFLEDALSRVDRSKQPWVIVEFHRPMYNNEKYASDYAVAKGMQAEFEELLVKYDVDLVLAGHYHSYLRTTRIYQDKVDDENGIYHFTIGSAGASLDIVDLYSKDWVENFTMEFGIGKITVANSTHMHWEYIENKEDDNHGKVTDEVWIIKRT